MEWYKQSSIGHKQSIPFNTIHFLVGCSQRSGVNAQKDNWGLGLGVGHIYYWLSIHLCLVINIPEKKHQRHLNKLFHDLLRICVLACLFINNSFINSWLSCFIYLLEKILLQYLISTLNSPANNAKYQVKSGVNNFFFMLCFPARWIKPLQHQQEVPQLAGQRERTERLRERARGRGRKMETNAWGIELPEPFLIII